jgi:phosphorylase kinase alpha/beta subunit
MWERLTSPLSSSIGMAKAALEAMNGLNLFGSQGSSLSIIHVDPDAQYRNRVILNHLLPRESSSKATDASLLCITGYPAFAIDDPDLCKLTEQRTCELLEVCVL